MGAIRYSCPIRLVPTYILPEKKEDFSGKPDTFKTDGQTDGHG